MIKDARAEFCAATALSTAATGLALVGNVLDQMIAKDAGEGRPLYLVIQVTTAVTSAGAATVQFEFVSDSVAALHVDGSAQVHWASAIIPKASLVAGYELITPLPWGSGVTYKEFLGIEQNVGTAALTAGAINAFLTLDPALSPTYPAANS